MKRLLYALLLAGCASNPDSSATPTLVVRDLDEQGYDQFVQPVLEQNCGSLDCHGKTARGLRIYGKNGLRLASNAAGVQPTSPDEIRATYLSVIGLQPELWDSFVATSPRTAEDAYGLLLLAKPLAIERHRPGETLRKGEPAERCITSWLIGSTDERSCIAGGE